MQVAGAEIIRSSRVGRAVRAESREMIDDDEKIYPALTSRLVASFVFLPSDDSLQIKYSAEDHEQELPVPEDSCSHRRDGGGCGEDEGGREEGADGDAGPGGE